MKKMKKTVLRIKVIKHEITLWNTVKVEEEKKEERRGHKKR